EISVPSEHARSLADALLAHNDVKPIGLGARDSLRLEAGLCLYGHDMDAARTPVEASLTWAVAKSRRERADFPGAARILKQIEDKPAERRVGLRLLDKAPAREGADIATKSGEIIGKITSGGPGPSYGAPIAMGYVARAYAAPGTELDIIVRERPRAAEVVKTPFVRQNYYRG
ncbi:MAG: glycine cleavage T C-terminal barrel domain-containing protein, partial [Pseudomonadota bacterium]